MSHSMLQPSSSSVSPTFPGEVSDPQIAPSPGGGGQVTAAWETPIGTMTGLIGPAGVRALRFPGSADAPVRTPPSTSLPPQITNYIAALTAFLRACFGGDDADLAAAPPPLDYSGATAFDRAVWEATRRIPRGRTRTYGQIAAEIGKPGAARAVGGALGRNPLVLLVPCHRVISSAPGARALCGFTGGLELKRYLLSLEGWTQ